MLRGRSAHRRGLSGECQPAVALRTYTETGALQEGIGIIGAGYWGRNLVRNFATLGKLQVVCDRDPLARAAISKDYPGFRITPDPHVVLNDPAVVGVAIATPAATHGRMVRDALRAGKHVLVEKPLCLSLDEGRQLVALADAVNRKLMVGHLLWYHPAILKLKTLIDQGALGSLQYIYSNRLNLGKIRREENILWSFAPHDISVILGLIEETPESVWAQGGNYLDDKNTDVTVSVFTFASGLQAHVFVSWLHPFKEQKLVVVGEKQMAVFDDLRKGDKLVLYPHSIDLSNQTPITSKAEPKIVPISDEEPLLQECSHFIECIASGTQPRTDGHEGLRVLEVLDRCQWALSHPTPLVECARANAGR